MILGSIGKALFGSEPKAKVTTASKLTPEQENRLKELLANLNLPEGLGEAVVPFEGRLSAGLQPVQQTSLAALEQMALNLAGGGSPTGTGLQGQAETALSGLLTEGPTDFEDFFKTNVEAPLLKSFEEEVVPRLQATQARNFFSTGAQRAQDRGQEQLLDTLGRERSGLAFATREADRNRRLQALGLVDTITGLPINQAAQLLAIGEIPRQIEQAGLSAEYAEFIRQQQQRSERVQQLLQAIGLPVLENIATVTEGSTGLVPSFLAGGGIGDIASIMALSKSLGTAGATAGAGAGAASLAGFIPPVVSSEKLKDVAEEIDEEDVLERVAELPIHRWKYLGDDTDHIGPMAEAFSEAFDVGDGKTIALVDVMGVTMATNKALARRLEALEG